MWKNLLFFRTFQARTNPVCTRTPARTYTHARTRTHTHTHAYTHTLTHIRLHTYAYTHTLTHTPNTTPHHTNVPDVNKIVRTFNIFCCRFEYVVALNISC